MTIDDETVRRILDATFDAVATEVAIEAERGALVHASPSGCRTYARQDDENAVITTAGPDGGVTRSEYVGVNLADIT